MPADGENQQDDVEDTETIGMLRASYTPRTTNDPNIAIHWGTHWCTEAYWVFQVGVS